MDDLTPDEVVTPGDVGWDTARAVWDLKALVDPDDIFKANHTLDRGLDARQQPK